MKLLELQILSLSPCKWDLSPPPPLLFSPSHSGNPPRQPVAFSLSHNPTTPVSHFRRFSSVANPPTLRYSRWDSPDAGSYRSRRFSFNSRYGDEDDEDDDYGFGTKRKRKRKKRRWWSDDSSKFSGEEEEEEEDEDVEEKPAWVLAEVIDSLLIVKVFRSYGWTLPVIMLSLLLATGPKAFLITLALFSGLSALVLAFEKLWPQLESKSKNKSRRKKRRSHYSRTAFRMEEEQVERRERSSSKIGYESWVSQVDFSAEKPKEDSNSLGGWDEPEGRQFVGKSPPFSQRSQGIRMDNGRSSRKGSRDDAPLLIRVLIALFPFLASWTEMFW